MVRIQPINPVGNIPRVIGGTDLGVPFNAFGQIGVLLGDSFGRFNGQLLPQVRGDDWRSPIILWTNRIGSAVRGPMKVTGAVNGGDQLWNYPHNNPTFSTVLPCDCMQLGERLHVWVMVCAGLGNEKWCELAYSDNRGATWRNDGPWNTGRFRGMRVMLTFDIQPGTEFIDVFSTGGLARNKSMLRWRVRPRDFTTQSRWEGWCFKDGRWQWVINPADHEPSDILPGWRLGEINFRWIQGNACMSGFDAGDYSIFVKIAKNTDANWVTAPTYRPVTGIPRGVDVLAQLYGGYIHPESTFSGGFTMMVSNWNTSTGNPYQTTQYYVPGIWPAVAVDGMNTETESEEAIAADAGSLSTQTSVRIKLLVAPATDVDTAYKADADKEAVAYTVRKLEVPRSFSCARLLAKVQPQHVFASPAAGGWRVEIAVDLAASGVKLPLADGEVDTSDKVARLGLKWVDVSTQVEAAWSSAIEGSRKVLVRVTPFTRPLEEQAVSVSVPAPAGPPARFEKVVGASYQPGHVSADRSEWEVLDDGASGSSQALAAAAAQPGESISEEYSSIDFGAEEVVQDSMALCASASASASAGPSALATPGESRMQIKQRERGPYGGARAVIGGVIDDLVDQLHDRDAKVAQLESRVRELEQALARAGIQA